MKSLLLQTLLVATALAAAVPLPRQAEGLDVVKTVVLKDGQVLDWVRRESQDANFSLPLDWSSQRKTNALAEKFTSLIPQHLRGPEGTVPIPRPGLSLLPPKQLRPIGGPHAPTLAMKLSSASQDYTGEHWYASTSKQTKVTGGGGGISMFEPYLQSQQEFSLVQTAIVRYEAKTVEFGTIPQSLEAGWMYYPPRGPKPMFFVFFNTNGYHGVGDYMCGWNTEQKGWVQVDDSIYPGMSFEHMSVIGGEQHDFDVHFHLSGGRWWLKAFGKDIGYYSADLFSKKSKKEDTLASYGDRIDFYGEVYNSGPALTTTDMGSGNFPEAGDGKVGYVKNMVYLDGDGKQQIYSGYTQESDASRYRIKTFFNSGTSWDSYVYLGGPGANGVVGG
ncbi:hypothetical protein A9K55_002214 [Cordyceps militaris]|uniref:Neprosin PEP catalytic domain-containing protein n=1 Tax=Cordyceps militaris TaxID=73501 RepID=A0A2H4S7N9_CORMI|nr:hypothetical protein A9K55_002214 [Cordyceps militaris]